MRTGRIAMKDLQKEKLNCHNRIQLRIIPPHARIETSLFNSLGRQFVGPVLLELLNDIRDNTHRRSLLVRW